MTKLLQRHLQPEIHVFKPGMSIRVDSLSLKNGPAIFIIDAGNEDILRIEFIFNAGIVKEELPLVASTTNMMLTEGSDRYTSEELNAILDYYGVFLNQNAEKDTSGMTLYILNRHLEKVLELSREILFHPAFPERELNILMNKRLSWYQINRGKVQNLANDQFFESLFGSQHPYGRQVKEGDFASVTPSLLKDFHTKYYSPRSMTVVISGKIHENTMDLFRKYFEEVRSPEVYIEESASFLFGSSEKRRHIRKEGAVQTAVRIGSASINKRHPDYPGLKILNMVLGGYFGSRLMKNLREKKGYTYGVHSSVSSLDLSGFKVISTEVGKVYAASATEEIYSEIKRLQEEPLPPDELEVVRKYMSGEMVRMFDGPFALAESFKAVWEFGLDLGYFTRLMDKINTITQEEIIELARKYYNTDDLYEITAGEK